MWLPSALAPTLCVAHEKEVQMHNILSVLILSNGSIGHISAQGHAVIRADSSLSSKSQKKRSKYDISWVWMHWCSTKLRSKSWSLRMLLKLISWPGQYKWALQWYHSFIILSYILKLIRAVPKKREARKIRFHLRSAVMRATVVTCHYGKSIVLILIMLSIGARPQVGLRHECCVSNESPS